MDNFFTWFSAEEIRKTNPWLVIGKGPSYSKINEYDTSSFLKISLNHVIRDQKVDIAHTIDFDVALDCAEHIYENAAVLVMPWRPHIENWVSIKTLDHLLDEHPILAKLREEGRVKYYNLGSCKVPRDNSQVIPTNYFSSEAVVNLLSKAGVKKIRTIGVDGGSSYSDNFRDLADKTLLNNGHQNFNIQFKSIAKKIMNDNLDYAPLDVPSPVKVYVGSMEEQLIAVRVLEYSIKKNASLPVEVMPLYRGGIAIPMPKDPKKRPRTPFSFQRFLIPKLNGFKGRAIYVDSDMQVFNDIKDLWTRPMGSAEVLSAYETGAGEKVRKPQYSVMLLDCDKLKWEISDIVNKLDSGELTYEQLMYEMKVARSVDPIIEKEWNSLEFYEAGKTNLLHYTDMHRQPWLFTSNPNTKVWVKELHEALMTGFISWMEVKEHIKKGYVRPSLWLQLTRKKFDPKSLPSRLYAIDRFFVPPHKLGPSTSKVKLAVNKIIANLTTTVI